MLSSIMAGEVASTIGESNLNLINFYNLFGKCCTQVD